MAVNRGKQFEDCFRQDWEKYVPNTFLYRLQDQVSGFKYTSANACDFIAYKYPHIYLFECKSHSGKSFPLSALTQYDKLLKYKNIYGLQAIVILWLIDCDCVLAIPITEIEKMKSVDKKSINEKDIDNYKIIKIPSIKKRILMESDYSYLVNILESEGI